MEFKQRLQQILYSSQKELTSNPIAVQLANNGKSRPLMDVDLRDLYTRLFKDIPAPVNTDFLNIKGGHFDVEKFLQNLEPGWEEVRKLQTYVHEDAKFKTNVIVLAKENGFLISIHISHINLNEKKRLNYDNEDKIIETANGSLIVSSVGGKTPVMEYISVIHPMHFVGYEYVNEELDKIAKLFSSCHLSRDKDAAIGIIASDHSSYYVKHFSLSGKTPEFKFPDLHYGEGFEDFHNNLIQRLGTQNKGLVLLHGDPGTGKTQYIRVLLKELAKLDKSVLYAPPSLSAALTDPEMIAFISEWVIGNERDCILLIEDAEPLLEIRNGSDGRTTGISNLLNMTDGLLNDILGLTVIATFNTDISKIDPALLRQQRLIARKKFKKISKERAEKLADALKIQMPDITYPASLADFYANEQNSKTLIHDLDEERKTIGFK